MSRICKILGRSRKHRSDRSGPPSRGRVFTPNPNSLVSASPARENQSPRTPRPAEPSALTKYVRAVSNILDPRVFLQLARLSHYYAYTHFRERKKILMGENVRFSPNVSIVRGDLISIGHDSHIGARCHLWAGEEAARIDIGEFALLAPEVFVTTTNYQVLRDIPVMNQPKNEKSVRIGAMTWLGARVIVLAGVTIGDGCVVAAGSVVTKDLPENSISAGVPARVIGERPERATLP